jgi:tetratricopeptide (TPR) repeat protein
MVDDRPCKGFRGRETKSALFKVLSSALAAVFFASAPTINAQNDDWHEKIARAKEAVRAARYDEAAIIAAEAMDIVGRDNTKDPRLPDTINLLAVAKHLQGRFIEAEGLFQDAIATFRTGSESRDRGALASTLYNLAQTQIELQEYVAAEGSLSEIEAIRRDGLVAGLPDIEDVLSLYAFVYQAKGLVTEAEASAKRAVSLALKHVGISPEQVAIVYNSQGRIFLANRRYDEAARSFREALAWAERARGVDHPFTARAMFHLAEVHLAQARTDLALPLLTKGLRVVNRDVGPDSIASAEGLADLGHLYMLDRKFALAQQALDRALTIEEAAFGRSNPRLVPVLNRCAAVRVLTNKNEEALAILLRSLEIGRAIPWLQRTFATMLRDLAFLETRMGRLEEADQAYQRAITTMEAVFGSTDDRVLATLKAYASLLRTTRRSGLKDVNQRIKVLQAMNRTAPKTDPNSRRSPAGDRSDRGGRD